MRVRFWGVRGSLPSPTRPNGITLKLAEALARARPEDIADGASRRRFLASLPPWLRGTVGGNTPCTTVDIEGLGAPLIFDCGSGIREFGKAAVAEGAGAFHLFMSHFHWDHIEGLPFFGPAYDPAARIDFHSPDPAMETSFSDLMRRPYFPIGIADTAAAKRFNLMEGPLTLGPATISSRRMGHPDGSFAYRIDCAGRRFIYATDAELCAADFAPSAPDFFAGADALVMDAQYTPAEAAEKSGWGHSSHGAAVEFAARWGIGHLVLFHHDPESSDEKLYGMLRSARRYHRRAFARSMRISLAYEGMEIVL